MNNIGFIEIDRLDHPLIPAWKALYLEAFPPSERMGWKSHFERCITERPRTHFVLAITVAEEFAGLASYEINKTDVGEVLYLWYLATVPQRRGQGIGQAVMTEIKRRAEERGCVGVVIEVAIPELAPNRDEARLDLRRIGFYRRQGARLVRHIYYQQAVTVDEGDEQPEKLPMHLMILPIKDLALDEYRVIAEAMEAEVIGEFGLE